jgi:hypothetical protein
VHFLFCVLGRVGYHTPEREPIPPGERAWRAATGYAVAHAPPHACVHETHDTVCVCTDAASGAQSDGHGTLATLATVRKAASALMQSEVMPMRNLRLHSLSMYSERVGMRTRMRMPSRSASSRFSCVSM